MIRTILGVCIGLALALAPFGAVVLADHHEEKASMGTSSTTSTSTATKAVPAGPVNINTAGTEELQTLPNIGPKKAQAILDYRKEHGNFTSIDELKNVSGIGEKTLDGLKQYLTL